MSIVSISTSALGYNKQRKTLIGKASYWGSGFPTTVEVTSHHTNRVVTYFVDEEVMLNNEFFDGEECHYLANDPTVAAQKLVVTDY